jgi:hypothetical protein
LVVESSNPLPEGVYGRRGVFLDGQAVLVAGGWGEFSRFRNGEMLAYNLLCTLTALSEPCRAADHDDPRTWPDTRPGQRWPRDDTSTADLVQFICGKARGAWREAKLLTRACLTVDLLAAPSVWLAKSNSSSIARKNAEGEAHR